MLEKFMILFISAAALVIVCWILAEYWLGMKASGHHEEVGRLRFGSRTAFALAHFWKRMDDAREIPDDTLKHEMGLADNGLPSRDKKADR